MIDENETNAAKLDSPTETEILQYLLFNYFFPKLPGCLQYERVGRFISQDPWDTFRTMSYAATHGPNTESSINGAYSHAYKTVMRHITSAPAMFHLLLTRLIRAGVITWQRGSYHEVQYLAPEHTFDFKKLRYDGLIASRMISTNSDVIWNSLKKATVPVHVEPSRFAKGRFLRSAEGMLANIIELGIPGHGDVVHGHCFDSRWNDTNSFKGAHSLLPRVAELVAVFEIAVIQHIRNPPVWMMQNYDHHMPTEPEFDEFVEQFQGPFSQLMDLFSSKKTLHGTAQWAKSNSFLRRPSPKYRKPNDLSFTPSHPIPFNPMYLEEFLAISVDFTPQEARDS